LPNLGFLGKLKAPKAFSEAYPGSEFHVIEKENFLEYLN